MSELLQPLSFPLHGSRLIEASAGTGKTWTIAALYVRLVLGQGGEHAFGRALMPSEILVMTFTRAATRELSNRVRERLIEAAAYFRGQQGKPDPYLDALLESYPDETERRQAAHRLMLAAETMDEAAIFTIDAWCQRMLREHAFDSGSLFDEELVSDETALFDDAAHDYWRQQVYPLAQDELDALLQCWGDVAALKVSVGKLAQRPDALQGEAGETLDMLMVRKRRELAATLASLKAGWPERIERMEGWITQQRGAKPKRIDGAKLKTNWTADWFGKLRAWVDDAQAVEPALTEAAWRRLSAGGMSDACEPGVAVPEDFAAIDALSLAVAAIEQLPVALMRHAAATIARRMQELKSQKRQFGFADMLERLRLALRGANGEVLRQRIVQQYPVAMVDEFQDTSPQQYEIFNLLYRVQDNDPERGLFLIGDPKQSIYGFRGADIHSYLDARRATAGRHYLLGTNFRSTTQVVAAVNRIFLHGETGQPRGAFRFRDATHNPLPFDAVGANGRDETLVGGAGELQAMLVNCAGTSLKADEYRDFFAQHCAEHIVGLLNDPAAGFDSAKGWRRLQPADIAILVRNAKEANAVRRALQRRAVRSVYLSDKDSVLASGEAADVLRWLSAVAAPLDGMLARAAFATRTAALPLAELAQFSSDELAWERRVEQLKALHGVWQRQGVLAMLRRFIHELGLPVMLLADSAGGERRLTNLLHLAELLQSASRQLDGEQALIRWLAEQIDNETDGGEERVLRLESDAELVKVITVHKSKGLEYPLVYLPYAATLRKVEKRFNSYYEYADADGLRQLDLTLGEAARLAADRARLEEDLRLLYVALTRARHFLWLGVAGKKGQGKGEGNSLHESAVGYLLNGGEKMEMAALAGHWETLRGDCAAIAVAVLEQQSPHTALGRVESRPVLLPPRPFDAHFERDWSVGSFSSLVRRSPASAAGGAGEALPPPRDAGQEKLLEGGERGAPQRVDEAPWHRFPRGSVPGNFLHEQLEWLGGEGFDSVHQPTFAQRMGRRIERAGWGHRQDDALAWLQVIASTPLPPLGTALDGIGALLAEMEFWFPSERLGSGALDHLCRQHLLDGVARPALPERQLHGMLKGFCDLVFEHEGRYWVLDYKSNALGGNDASYHQAALVHGMAEHRYDVQGAIYLLALHRLLARRLGPHYDPARQLGGAVFYFLRGVGNADTRGCYLLAPQAALLDGLDALLRQGGAAERDDDE